MHMHIGSQITSTEPYAGAVAKGVELIGRLREMGHPIAWYNMGGGYGINYKGHEAPADRGVRPGDRAGRQGRRVPAGDRAGAGDRRECGHPAQPCVIYQAVGREAVPDPGRRDERPDPAGACTSRIHRIWPVGRARRAARRRPRTPRRPIAGTEPWDVVGPVCESGDFLAKDRPLPRLDRGALLAIFSAGAYGMVMASNYNTRPRAAEVLVDGPNARLVRRRETYEDLVRHEVESLT